jgi:hypothetical protein
LLLVASPAASAQESHNENSVPANEHATTLDTVRVTAPRPEALDLDRFKNPIDPKPSRFDRAYREPLSLEQIGQNGGVIPLLVGYIAEKVAKGASRIPGWKDREQPAIARPPPLTEEQMERALRLQESAP